MKRILGIVMVLGLVGALTVVGQEVNPGKVDVVDFGEGVKLEMVLVPAGKFKMGSPKGGHEVTLTKAFYMGKYEVTQEQWEGVMKNNPSNTKGAKLPVTNVSWEDCQDFIKKLNVKTNGGYRLPTEAEWEYACRAGTTTAYSYGDSITKDDANVGAGSLKAVGGYKPNAFGLYDMHGNVYEWCEDWYGEYPKGAVTDPMGPGTGKEVVYRGGAVGEGGVLVSCSDSRNARQPFIKYNGLGLRLVRTADSKASVASPTETKPDLANIIPAAGDLLVAPFTEVKAKEVQKEVAKSLHKEVEEKEDLGKDVKLEMVLIPAGEFKRGDPTKSDNRSDEVTLTKPFYLGKYEVTQEQYETVMGDNPSYRKGADLPVTMVSWEDCQEFIKKLNGKTRGGYRLPTEAEWEYACRAGTTTEYSFGDKLTKSDANIRGESVKAVGSYRPNAFGLYDMHGNVNEWCEDWEGEYPSAVTDPKGPATGKYRVMRGGSFQGNGNMLVTSSFRMPGRPSGVNHDYGFRLAKTADLKAKSTRSVNKNNTTAPKEEIVNLDKNVKLDMVLVPAGKFKMGSPESENGRNNDEKQHEVTITKPFYMGKYEVTQEQYESVMEINPSNTKGAKLPVTDVSWQGCQEFIRKLNAKTEGGYRLPTEAEWEYACRAGTTTAYSYGDYLNKSDANCDDSKIGPVAVGSYKPNAFGLYDMHGNVWEWCEDWIADYPAGAVTDPQGPAKGEERVLRGGSFFNGVLRARSSGRVYVGMPTDRSFVNGFRLARTP